VQVFSQQLNYRYLSDLHNRPNNSNIETEILTTFLCDKQGYSDRLITITLYERMGIIMPTLLWSIDIKKEPK
jgi:type I restriction enzyme, R subunit